MKDIHGDGIAFSSNAGLSNGIYSIVVLRGNQVKQHWILVSK